jgi:cell wall-associated NlpC family hydrolase
MHLDPSRLIVSANLIFALLIASTGPPARAATAGDRARAQYASVRHEVAKLDRRAERLTEHYNQIRLVLHELRGQIRESSDRLEEEQRRLAQARTRLGELLTARYKGQTASTLEIVLGASSISEVTNLIDAQTRFDAAVSTQVKTITDARNQIVAERSTMLAARAAAIEDRHRLERRRREIRHELERRKRLMTVLGSQVRVADAASRFGQEELALRAVRWIRADQRSTQDSGARLRDQVALESLEQIGVPYKWGGASPETGFDCSGLMTWLWAKHGVALPHYAASQYAMGPLVDRSELRIGDLVFFHDLTHMGMYIGNGYMIHAPHTGTVVQIADLSKPWYQTTWVGATRPGPA